MEKENRHETLHVKDVVDAFILALSHPSYDGQAINVGSGTAITINKLAYSLMELSGQRVSRPTYTDPREGEVMNIWADMRKARIVIGFAPSIEIHEGLTKCIDKQEDEQ